LIGCLGFSLLLYACLELAGNELPRPLVVSLAGVTLATILACAAFTFLLASSLYKPWIAALLVIPGIIPYLWLVIILLLNVQAIRVLKRNGIRISFLGADPSAN
jgi:hypothetical protein